MTARSLAYRFSIQSLVLMVVVVTIFSNRWSTTRTSSWFPQRLQGTSTTTRRPSAPSNVREYFCNFTEYLEQMFSTRRLARGPFLNASVCLWLKICSRFTSTCNFLVCCCFTHQWNSEYRTYHDFPQGKNGLLFTYGVTGSGKTHTMQVF